VPCIDTPTTANARADSAVSYASTDHSIFTFLRRTNVAVVQTPVRGVLVCFISRNVAGITLLLIIIKKVKIIVTLSIKNTAGALYIIAT